MSNYTLTKTNFANVDTLVAALCQCGFTKDQIEIYNTPQPLYGYENDLREQKAQVIIRRQHVGPYANDIGFYIDSKEPANCRSYISEFDASSNGYNESWQKKLKQAYALEGTKASWAKRGFEMKTQTTEDGKIRLTMGRKVSQWK